MPVVGVGGTVTLRADVRNGAGQPVDATNLTLLVKDPGGADVAGFPVVEPAIVRDSLGTYHYPWAVDIGATLGDYVAYWSGQVNGGDVTGQEVVEVVAAGSIDFGQAYLTVDQFRQLVPTSLVDEALQFLLGAAQLAIVNRYGPIGQIIDVRTGGRGLVQTSRQVGAITSVEELYVLHSRNPDQALRDALLSLELWAGSTTLAADDYLVDPSGYLIQRMATGTHPAEIWAQGVKLTYTAFDDMLERKRVQLALVKLDIASNPGILSERIGDWQVQYTRGIATYAEEREDILGSLDANPWGFA